MASLTWKSTRRSRAESRAVALQSTQFCIIANDQLQGMNGVKGNAIPNTVSGALRHHHPRQGFLVNVSI